MNSESQSQVAHLPIDGDRSRIWDDNLSLNEFAIENVLGIA